MLQSDRGAVAPVEEFVFDGSEACPVVARRGPKEPTALEIEQHNACHEPFREWCRACVVGRGHQDPHHTRNEEKSLPVIVLDYGFLRQRPTGSGEDGLSVAKGYIKLVSGILKWQLDKIPEFEPIIGTVIVLIKR